MVAHQESMASSPITPDPQSTATARWPWFRWLGAGLAVSATWPMAVALEAVERRDWLASLLLLALTWLVARTGLDLASLPSVQQDPS